MFDFVKQMYAAGCDIKPYLDLGAITQAQFDEITRGDPTNTAK